MAPRSTSPKKPAAKKSRSVSAGTKKQADKMEKLLVSPAPRKPAARSPSPAAKKSPSAGRVATPAKKPAPKKAASPPKAAPKAKTVPAKNGRSSSPTRAAADKAATALAGAPATSADVGLFAEKPVIYSRRTTRRLDDLSGLIVIVVGTIYMVMCGYFLYRELMIDGKSAIPNLGLPEAPVARATPKATVPKATIPKATTSKTSEPATASSDL